MPLTKLTQLKVLEVSHIHFWGLAQVLPLLGKGLPQLEVLDLSGADLKVSELHLFQSFSNLHRVNYLANITSQFLAGTLHNKPKTLLPLVSISLLGSSVQLDSVKAYIQEARGHLENVTLHCFKSPGVAEVISALADAKHLRQLSLHDVDLHGPAGASVAALKQLTSLQISSCIANASIVQHIVSSLPGLTGLELHLEKFLELGPILDGGSDKQGSSILPVLTSLTIWDVRSEESCGARALPLLQHFLKLQTLKIYGLERVVGALEHLSCLTNLVDLSLGALPTAELVKALVPLSHLVALRLVGTGAYGLSDSLKLQLPVVGLHFTKLKQLRILDLPLGLPFPVYSMLWARVSHRFYMILLLCMI
jgi:hypothetical protein